MNADATAVTRLTHDGFQKAGVDWQPIPTCSKGGLLLPGTLANKLLGTLNELGPLSSAVHKQEPALGALAPPVHEVSCVAATVGL